MTSEELKARCRVTGPTSVAVYDRPVTEETYESALCIGTANGSPRGPEAFRPHYSLAGRSAARVQGEFATVGDAVAALIADYESGRKYPVL